MLDFSYFSYYLPDFYSKISFFNTDMVTFMLVNDDVVLTHELKHY